METQIDNNYQGYLETPLKVGFTQTFPQESIIDSITVTTTIRGKKVTFNVHYGLVSYGDNKDGNSTCHAIFTDRAELPERFRSWGSHSYIDEGKAMEVAVIEMCKKHNLMICAKICSWPFAKAIVQDNQYKN